MATAQPASQTTVMLSASELEALIRRVVREELTQALGYYEEPTIIEPGSPVYDDLVETLKMAKAGTLKILSREEALGAD